MKQNLYEYLYNITIFATTQSEIAKCLILLIRSFSRAKHSSIKYDS